MWALTAGICLRHFTSSLKDSCRGERRTTSTSFTGILTRLKQTNVNLLSGLRTRQNDRVMLCFPVCKQTPTKGFQLTMLTLLCHSWRRQSLQIFGFVLFFLGKRQIYWHTWAPVIIARDYFHLWINTRLVDKTGLLPDWRTELQDRMSVCTASDW